MPAFLHPQQSRGQKRQSDGSDANYANRKKQATDSGSPSVAMADRTNGQYWMVQWRAPQYKKHKTWDGDAVLVVNGNSCTLFDTDGRQFASGKPHGIEGVHNIVEGANFTVGSRELEIDCAVERNDFLSGRCFGRGGLSSPAPVPSSSGTASKQFVPLRPKIINSFKSPSVVATPEKRGVALEAVDLVSSAEKSASKSSVQDSFWTANWRKPQHKKHKTWEGDGYVMHRGDKLTLISDKGVILGTKKWDGLPLYSTYTTFIGGRDVELDNQISEAEMPRIAGTSTEPALDLESSMHSSPGQSDQSSFLLRSRQGSSGDDDKEDLASSASLKNFIPPTSFYGKVPAKPKTKGPLHDPDAEGAIVMKAPTKEHAAKYNKKNLPTVAVVIDPVLARRLRPHQVEGVKFLYECVMGLRKHEGQGCILADEMGMGKTLQMHRNRPLRWLGHYSSYVSYVKILTKHRKQVAVATAQILFQRFWFVTSMKQFGIGDVGMGALYLASKLEECPIRMRDLINVYDLLLHRAAHTASTSLSHARAEFKYIPMSYFGNTFYDLKDALVVAEMQILKRLGFHVHVVLPYGTLINYLRVLDLTGHEHVCTRAWGYLNDALQTPVYALYAVPTIVSAAILLATRHLGIALPSSPESCWWELFDADWEDVWSVSGFIMRLYRERSAEDQMRMLGMVSKKGVRQWLDDNQPIAGHS